MHMQEMIKNKFRDIIQNINKGVPEKVRRSSELLVALMVYDSLDVITPEERCEYMTVFYKLLLHVHTHNPRMAYHMVSGVLLFGQSEEGLHYQPFLDHLMIELFDSYITSSGWQILKPFTNTLRNSIRSIESEQIFTHIIKRVVAQLTHDETNIDESSDICYNLPREKSFNWGWFSYYVGVALADKQAHVQAECRGRQQKTKKMLRACMMSYRILITLLRNVQREYFTREEQDDIEYEHVSSRPITPCPGPSITPEEVEEDEDMDETWAGILHMIQSDKYKWTENVIRVSLYWSPLPASVSQLPPNTFAAVVDAVDDVPITDVEVPTNTTDVTNDGEVPPHVNDAVPYEVVETPAITSTTPEAEVEIKSVVVASTTRSWFSWFGL